MLKKRFIILLSIPILLLSLSHSVFASELNFSVSAVIPDNQVDKKQTYFDLHMEPNKKQTLEVTMRNDTKKDVIVDVNINTAMTNNNAVIDYSQTEFERDPTLKVDIEDLVDYEKEVTVKANSEKTYPITIEMPAEEIRGILLGGIHFEEKEKEKPEEERAQIENKFAYIIGLKVEMDEADVEPSLELNEIKPTQINHRNAVTANLQNTEPTIVSPLEIEAKVFKEKGTEPLFTSENENARMAPNSNFDYAISWDNQEFKSGTYRLELKAVSDDDVWEWEELFTIEGDEAKELNKEAVELEKNYTMWYVIGGIILLIILLALVYWLGTRKKDKKEESN